MPAAATLPESILQRPLSDVVESPRAIKALAGAGLTTLGDVAVRGLGCLGGIKHVGEATRSLIVRAIGPLPEAPEDNDEIEEGVHPLRLDGPISSMRISLLPTHRHTSVGGVTQLDTPLYIEFQDGEATLTKKAWLTRIYERDRARVEAGMKDAALPWRRDAAAWLRSLDTHARAEFRVLGD